MELIVAFIYFFFWQPQKRQCHPLQLALVAKGDTAPSVLAAADEKALATESGRLCNYLYHSKSYLWLAKQTVGSGGLLHCRLITTGCFWQKQLRGCFKGSLLCYRTQAAKASRFGLQLAAGCLFSGLSAARPSCH